MRRAPDIEYVTTFTHIHALHTGQSLRAPCLTFSARAAWRRARRGPGLAWHGATVRRRWSGSRCIRATPRIRLCAAPGSAGSRICSRNARPSGKSTSSTPPSRATPHAGPHASCQDRQSRRTSVDARCCKECGKPCDHPVGTPYRKRREDTTRPGAWTLLPSACPHAGRENTRGIDGDDYINEQALRVGVAAGHIARSVLAHHPAAAASVKGPLCVWVEQPVSERYPPQSRHTVERPS